MTYIREEQDGTFSVFAIFDDGDECCVGNYDNRDDAEYNA